MQEEHQTGISSQDLAVQKAITEILYDVDVPQRINFHTERKGKLYPVAHIFKPEALKHQSILDFERAKNQRLSNVDVTEVDERDARAVTGRSYQAKLDFWEKHIDSTEGYKGKVSDKDKTFAVDQLFSVGFDELPLAMGDELCPEDDDDSSTYRLKCVTNGKLIVTTHELRPANSDEISDSEALSSRLLLVQGTKFGETDQRIPSKAKRWGELYDAMKVTAGGYAQKVPLHHKMSVAIRHLQNEQKLITGN